ncbi:MAG: methyl-accepting chemotaxis protein [bacterium]
MINFIKKKASVRNKLLVFILLPLLLVLGFLTLFTYNQVVTSVTGIVETEGFRQVRGNSRQISEWISGRESILAVLEDTLELEEGWDQQDNVWDIIDDLNSRVEVLGSFNNLLLLNENGEAWTTQDRDVYDMSSQGYFEKVRNKRELIISEISSSILDNSDIFTLVTPVRDNDGNIVAYLAGELLLEPVQEMVNEYQIGNTGYGYLIDKNGLAIAHPSEALELNFLDTGNERITPELANIAEDMIAEKNGVGNYSLDGIERFNYYYPVEGTDWSLALTVPVSEMTEAARQISINSIIAYLILFIIIGIIVFFVAASMGKNINSVQEALRRISNGDFREKLIVKTNDELGKMGNRFNETIDALNKSLAAIQNSSLTVGNASSEIAEGNQDLSQRTQEQASSLEEVSATIQEMTAAIEEVAASSETASELSENTIKVVNKGSEVVRDTMESMSRITASSKEIANIITTINDIAFQTNLLALNAAVEAARAGEHGKGFAVVAAEVRNLAGRTADSAEEIDDLISNIIGQIEDGNEKVDRTGQSLQEIVDNTKESNDAIKEIALAMQEQSTSADQIQSAVEELDQVTQENAALVEEISSSSDSLNDEARVMLKNVDKFKLNNDREMDFDFEKEEKNVGNDKINKQKMDINEEDFEVF